MNPKVITREELAIAAGIFLSVVLVDHAINHRRVKRELRLYREAFINAVDEYDALAQVTDDVLG